SDSSRGRTPGNARPVPAARRAGSKRVYAARSAPRCSALTARPFNASMSSRMSGSRRPAKGMPSAGEPRATRSRPAAPTPLSPIALTPTPPVVISVASMSKSRSTGQSLAPDREAFLALDGLHRRLIHTGDAVAHGGVERSQVRADMRAQALDLKEHRPVGL